jgi:hypothetical protein
MKPSIPLALALTLASFGALAAADHYAAEKAQAEANLRTESGMRYDRELSSYFAAQPQFTDKISVCLRQNPGPQAVRGYFRFEAGGGYRVVLRPASRFATCLESAMAGGTPPAPPSRPYLNDFNFTLDAG